MIVLVCGARNFRDRELLFSRLDELHAQFRLTEIIHGDSPGADALAGLWARERGIYARVFKADWQKYGKSAGAIRNDRMVHNGKPALVVAFAVGPDLKDLLERTNKARIALIKVPKRPKAPAS
jgi:hypothetical protein